MTGSYGVQNITARIQEINARIATLQPATTAVRSATTATASRTSAGTSAFDLTLQQATGTTASGKLKDGVPAELARYGNGRIPANALESLGVGNHKLWSPAARSFTQMKADAARAGVTIGVTDSYRSYEQQVDVARRKGLYSQGGLAAKPGTSDHGWGRSLDLDLNARAQTWMRANAGPLRLRRERGQGTLALDLHAHVLTQRMQSPPRVMPIAGAVLSGDFQFVPTRACTE